MIWLFFLLFTKHLVADYLYQPPWMYSNKGTFGHYGGIAHAGLHAILTMLILDWYTTKEVSTGLGMIEFVAHYAIDWAKMNLNAYYDWKCDTSPKFWWLLGLDQLLHQACYVAIVWWVYR